MKQTQNQYFGLKSQMPGRLPAGSTYLCEDSQELFLFGQDNSPHLISAISQEGSVQKTKSGYSQTGAFADKPSASDYVWGPTDGIEYTSSDVSSEKYKVLSLSTAAHNVVDIPNWTTPTPTGNTGIGEFQGAYLPSDITKLFDYGFDYDTAYPPIIDGSTVGYEVVGDAFMDITSGEFPDMDISIRMTQVSTTGTGTGLILNLVYKKIGPFTITGNPNSPNPSGHQRWRATTVRAVIDEGSGYAVNVDTINMTGLGDLANATIAYVDPYSYTGFEGSTGTLKLSDLEYGDQVKIAFDFDILPTANNTTVEPVLLCANRGVINDITSVVTIPSHPIFYANGIGKTISSRVEFTKEILSDEDVNAIALPAIKADAPLKIQPKTILTTIIR